MKVDVILNKRIIERAVIVLIKKGRIR